MTTFGNVIDEILDKLQGFSNTGDSMTGLAAACGSNDTTLTVYDTSGFSRGLAEIEQEIIYITGVDSSTGTLTIGAGFGRGARGTTATSHAKDTAVTMAPSWPRSAIAREINNLLVSLYPQLFVPVVETFTSSAITDMYPLNAAGDFLVDARWQFAPFDMQRIRKWEVQHVAGTNRLWVYDMIPVSSTIEVTYATPAATFTAESQDWSVCGLNASVKDLVILGVIANMVQFIDVSKVSSITAESDAMMANRPLGGGTNLANNFRQQYQQRLQAELQSQYARYPSHTHIVS